MKISKDEARILAAALEEFKYHPTNRKAFTQMGRLQERLETEAKDQRRTGRTSMDDFSDCLQRFIDKEDNRP